MPSKYGFGNTRTASPYKLASYGGDQKNPIKMGGPPGAGDRDHMLGSARRGRGYEKSSPAEMKSSPAKQVAPLIKGAVKAAKYIKDVFTLSKKSKKYVHKPMPHRKLKKTETKLHTHPQTGKVVFPKHGRSRTTNPNFIRNQAERLKNTQKYWFGK